MEYYYYEVRSDIIRKGPPVLVSADEGSLPRGLSFRSTFEYPQALADEIRKSGNTAGLVGLPISTTTIFVDVDDDRNVGKVQQHLLNLNIRFDRYTTGNRGAHFHIPLATRVTGVDTISSVTTYLKRVGVWNLIDTSIYRESGQFRLEGAEHTKTGRLKLLEMEFDGPLLELPITPKVEEKDSVSISITDEEGPEPFFRNLLQQRGVGGRHLHLFILWQCGKKSGLPEKDIVQAMLEWNERQENPHSEAAVLSKIRSFG